jgi:hypothetical protein
MRAYAGEVARLRRLLPALPLAGPATGSLTWLTHVSQFLGAVRPVAQVTFHRYPLNRCISDPAAPQFPAVTNLLSPLASRGLMSGVAPYIALTRRARAAFRIDELNSVTCQGRHGVSDTFASALWVLDTLCEMAQMGVAGVNIHIWPGAQPNELFTFNRRHGRWFGSVRPEYYGLLMFLRAAPPGSRLLPIAGAGGGSVRAWATGAPDGQIRVVLLNDSLTRTRSLVVRPPGASRGATVVRLGAANAYATSGVTLAGQRFSPETTTGVLAGHARATPLRVAAGTYRLELPAASAALLTIT